MSEDAARLVEEFYDGTAEMDWPAWATEAVAILGCERERGSVEQCGSSPACGCPAALAQPATVSLATWRSRDAEKVMDAAVAQDYPEIRQLVAAAERNRWSYIAVPADELAALLASADGETVVQGRGDCNPLTATPSLLSASPAAGNPCEAESTPSGFGPFTASQRKAMVPEDKSKPVFWCGNCGARNQVDR